MLTLIVDDDFTSRLLLQELLKGYGPYHVAVNGREAVDAVRLALAGDEYYDLICLDIMMPEMDGKQALKEIRALEEANGIAPSKGAKIVMTTAVADKETVVEALNNQCNYFIAKPIRKAKLMEVLRNLALIV